MQAALRTLVASSIALSAIAASAAEQPLPAGIRIPVVLTKSISAKLAVGAPVEGETNAEVKLPGSLGVIPKGARITGRISLAIPYDKKQSRFSLVLDRIEMKSGAFAMRAFIVGKLRARNSELGRGPAAAYREGGFERTDNTIGQVPAVQQILIDNSCKLMQSENPQIGSEVVSQKWNVALEIGSSFDVLTVEN